MPNPVAQLLIVLLDDGAVRVDGCVHDRMLSYGMLALAKEAICQLHLNAQQRVQPASSADLAGLLKQ